MSFLASNTAAPNFSFGSSQPQQQQQPQSSFTNFQNTSQTGFGSPNRAFGFGAQPAATTQSQFSFGQQPQTNFPLQAPPTSAPNFSFGGAPPQTATSVSFGQPPVSTGSNFSFTGFTSQPSTFGAPQQNVGFGQPPASGFGAQPTSGFGSSMAGFGAPASTGFGTSSSTGFGITPSSTFGAQPAQGFGTSLFSSQPTTFGGFGSAGFAPKPAAPFSFNTFGQQQPQQQQQQQTMGAQQQQPQVDESQAFYQSIFQCNKFADDRDSILASLNYIQACWGKGKGHYSQTFPPVTYTQTNPFYRFKAVGYSFIFTDSNEDGQVILTLKKHPDKVRSDETQMITAFQNMLNRPNILFKICGIKASGEDTTVILVAVDRTSGRRVPAYDLASALTQPYVKSQMDSLGIVTINPKVKPSPEQLKRYLENPPDGIDPRVWKQAQEDNPDSSLMIPVSIVGLEALKRKVLWQESENEQHQARLRLIDEEISNLMNRYTTMNLELQQLRRRQYDTAHRILRVVLHQDLIKKEGLPLQPEEEDFKKQLEIMDTDLNSPTKYKGQVNELMSQIRLHRSATESRGTKKYLIDPEALSQIKDFLSTQQESTKHLVEAIKVDLSNLKKMMAGLTELANKMTKP